MIKKTGLLLTALLAFTVAFAQKHTFSLGKKDFLLDGKPFQLISGEMHPARIPAEYWRHRIQMAKAMGCNTIAAYVFWNYHETAPGVFDFTTGNRNIRQFIRLCQQEGMYVLLRPGPYVCAEWDFGGLPAYLLKTPDIKVRCSDPRYLTPALKYVDRLAKEVKDLQCTSGGPILMVQVENEYGSYANDKDYLNTLAAQWRKDGINVPFYTSDGPTPYMLDAGTVPGAAIGLDSGGDEKDFNTAYTFNPDVPAFSGETYPGWLTHWGEKWARPSIPALEKEVKYLLDNKKSFNFYVIHGGTNFGFTAGANAGSPVEYMPDLTSYDYDAPVNEQGSATKKYMALRELIQKYTAKPLPPVPAPVPTTAIPAIKMQHAFNLDDIAVATTHIPQPQPMENFGQNQGLISYKTKLIGHKSGRLKIWEPHDYALVFLNGKFIDTVFRAGGHWDVLLPKTDVKDPELEIVVEGMGHINFAQFMIDRKGITDRVTLNGMTLTGWYVNLYPLDDNFIKQHKNTVAGSGKEYLNFFKGNFNLSATADTYIDMTGYKKGMVYINGHNLGRYWYIGPQQRLYCPASWLKKGNNEIIVFDLLQGNAADITGEKTAE